MKLQTLKTYFLFISTTDTQTIQRKTLNQPLSAEIKYENHDATLVLQ